MSPIRHRGSRARRSVLRRGSWLTGTLLAAQSALVAAQSPASADAENKTTELQEIMVTAQRRAESIQDVPVSVTAFSRESLGAAGITTAQDLQQVDPSLSMSSQGGAVIPFIRGIGNIASQTPGNESSVPIYIDDAYYSRLFVPYLSFADNIERVEVLKGPQGTLFGRNATGGLINIITRDPGQDRQLNVKVGYGSQQTWRGQLYAATPITENLAADISVVGQKMNQGFGTNIYDGKRTYFRDFLAVRTKVVWTPTETTKIKWSTVYVYDNSSIGAVQGGLPAGYTRGLPPDYTQQYVPPAGFYNLNVNFDTERNHRGWGTTLRWDQELGFADFSSISFYRDASEPWTSEGDHTSAPELQYTLHVRDKEFTQEFQIRSTERSPIKWIAGLYYMDAFAAYDPATLFGNSISSSGLDSLVLTGQQKIISKAAFAQTTVPIWSDTTNGTVGLRYTKDSVGGYGSGYAYPTGSTTAIETSPTYTNTTDFSKLTFKTSLDHHFTSALMGYASYSRGYKSGVFNLLPLAAPPVPPEVVDAYELGFKSTLFDGRLRFDIAGFVNNIAHLQTNVVVNTNGIATVQLASADKARTRGVEFSGDALLMEGLTARFSGQYVDPTFIKFPNAPSVTPIDVPPYGLVGGVADVSGLRLPQIPKYKLNLGLDYKFETAPGKWVVGGNISYRSGFPWEADNVVKAPSLTLINTSLTFLPTASPNTSIQLWGKNMTNTKYYSNILSQTGSAGVLASPDEPRTWGVDVGYKF